MRTDSLAAGRKCHRLSKILFGICMIVAATASAFAQDIDELLIGEWKMELRVLEYPGVRYYQEDASIFITERMPDDTYRILSRITTRAVAENENLLVRPECRGKKECIYDDASEGIGQLINGKLFVDWISEGWIDDVFTISGDTMTGDDGNGPIRLKKR